MSRPPLVCLPNFFAVIEHFSSDLSEQTEGAEFSPAEFGVRSERIFI